MRTCIVTVGLSLLKNEGRPWEGRQENDPLPEIGTAVGWLREEADLAKASAETNTLRLVSPERGDTIAFLHSATDVGTWCARVLEEYYRGQHFHTEKHEISGLNYKTGDVVDRGLRALVHLMFDLHRRTKERASETIFCATGGFKAETAYMYLAATLLGARVCYIHELYSELVWLPALPAKLDLSLVQNNEGFFAKASEVVNVEEIRQQGWFQSAPQLRNLVDEADDILQLNAAGMLMWELYRDSEGRVEAATVSTGKCGLAGSEMENWTPHRSKLKRLDECKFVRKYKYPHENVALEPRKGLVRKDPASHTVFVRALHGDDSTPLKVELIPMPEDLFDLAAEHIGKIFG